jgi:hypothetical protein
LEVYSVPQNIDARSLLLVCFVLNQNVPPKYLARTVLISLGNYPRVFFMQKSALYSNPSPTFGYDPNEVGNWELIHGCVAPKT